MTIRIARILGRSNVGGPTRTVLHLTRQLAADGFETLLIVGQPGAREGELLAADEPAVERLPVLRRGLGWSDLCAHRALKRILEQFRPHILHTHAAKAGALGRKAAQALKERPSVVHTFHGHVLDDYFSRPLSLFFRHLERRLARSTDCLVTVSARDAEDLSQRHAVAPREKFQVIENGIDLAPYRPPDAALRRAGRLRLGAGDSARLILVSARLAPIKQHRLLFDALDRLPASVLPVEVHLLGDGPLRSDLERRATRLREGVAVRFHGFRDDLPAVLPAADLVALSSRREGMPLALIEAMAAGVPVVATAVGGVPELVIQGKTGLLVPDGDSGSLAFALGRVLSDLQLARRLGIAGRRRALERHGLDRVVREHAELYRRLLRTRTRGPFTC